MKRVFVKRQDIQWRRIGEWAMLYDCREIEVLKLNPSAAKIWELITIDNPLDDIIRHIGDNFGLKRDTAGADVKRFVNGLKKLCLIEEYSLSWQTEKLKEAYERIPESLCERCAVCCANVIIYSSEFENIRGYLNNCIPKEQAARIMSKIFLNAAIQFKQRVYMRSRNIAEMPPLEVCAFLDDEKKECLIYSHRPLACRLYGWERRDECFTSSLRLKTPFNPEITAGRADSLRQSLELISRNYCLKEEGLSFNKAEINQWFHFQDKMSVSVKAD